MKKANFDISHELDEFLMVDKPLSATKRKANPNFDKMKPEFRQMEEQWVYRYLGCPHLYILIQIHDI